MRIVTEKELMEATGYKQRPALVKHLASAHIRYHVGKDGRLWTTLDCVNYSLIGRTDKKPKETLSF
jgi:hypothetical protein